MNYGYVRVSSKTQNEERQIVELLQHGIKIQNICMDKQSGKDFNRPGYKKLVRKLKKGDTLFVKSIDRFGRNYDEILEQWSYLTRNKKVDIVVLDMSLLDTRKCKDLLGSFISDLVLQILSYAAESQRASIRQNQADGIRAAKAKGVNFGRPRKIESEQFIKLYEKVECGELSEQQLCEQTGICSATYKRYVSQYIREETL